MKPTTGGSATTPLGRKTQKRQSGSTGPRLAEYGYDQGDLGVGRRTAMTDTSAITSWAHDARGRVITESHLSTAAGSYVLTYAYDSKRNLTGRSGVSYTYRDSAHVQAVTQAGGTASTSTVYENMVKRLTQRKDGLLVSCHISARRCRLPERQSQ